MLAVIYHGTVSATGVVPPTHVHVHGMVEYSPSEGIVGYTLSIRVLPIPPVLLRWSLFARLQ